MLLKINTIATCIMAISTIVYTITTIIYAFLTNKMLKQMDKNNKIQQQPLVYIYIDEENWDTFYLAIENVGRGVAYNIKFKFEEDFEYMIGGNISQLPLFNDLNTLKPAQKIKTFLDVSGSSFDNTPPKNFSINVSYEDEYGQIFNKKWNVSKEIYKKRVHVTTK